MNINSNNYSILEIIQMLERKELVVNKEYQRGSGLWPASASAFFIDTILEDFTFPKIYMYEYLDRPSRGMRKEIVDGQQRIGAIQRFYNDEFSLQAEGRNKGRKFSELDEEDRDKFFTYSVPVDVIRNASSSDILQMFRRMNAYTLPLNDPEKRHARYHGAFKWYVVDIADELNEFFVEFKAFTTKQITRMSDATLITDCILTLERGVISTNASDLDGLYKKYNENFPNAHEYREILIESINFIKENFGNLRGSYMMKPYALHSLFTALAHNRFGIESIQDDWGVKPTGEFAKNPLQAKVQLTEMAEAHEGKDTEGPHSKYVWGCVSTTDRRPRRTARVAAILRVLGAKVPEEVDAKLA